MHMQVSFSMQRVLAILFLLIFISGCLVSRPETRGKNCSTGGSACFENLVRACEAGYLESALEGNKIFLQVVGLVEGKCHVYGEGSQEGVSLNMECFLTPNSLGEFEFSQTTLECKGPLADAVRAKLAYDGQVTSS